MAISCTQHEALNKLRSNRPTKPIATFFETMFPESTLIACHVPLLSDALSLFEKHWAGAEGEEVQVFAHDVVDLLGRAAD